MSVGLRLRLMAVKAFVPLLWVRFTIIMLLTFSLSWVYPLLHEALDGRNYLNLISHLIFIGAT